MSSDFDESASTDVASTDADMDTVIQSPGANILSELGEASGQASPKQHVGGRDAMLSSQGQTSKDSSRLSTGDCNLLLNPPVNAAYELWLQKRNTAKKGLCWSFLDKVHSSKGMYPEVWRCIGCWPDVALFNVSYEATKDAAKLPPSSCFPVSKGCFPLCARMFKCAFYLLLHPKPTVKNSFLC